MIQNETGDPSGAAHNTTANPDDGYLQQETVDAITNLATATVSDRAAIAQLAATVARLMTELATVNAKLVVTPQTNRAIRGGGGRRNRTIHGRGDGDGEGAGTGNGAGAPARTGASAPTMALLLDVRHGCRHNSAKCPVSAASHIYMYTKRNMQGGAEEKQ